MFSKVLLHLSLAAGLLLALGACANRPPAAAQGLTPEAAADDQRLCGRCGEVRLIQLAEPRPAAVAPAGALLGGVSDRLRPGAGGTGLAGATERITLDMDIGGLEVLELPAPSGLREGDRVRLRGSTVEILREGL